MQTRVLVEVSALDKFKGPMSRIVRQPFRNANAVGAIRTPDDAQSETARFLWGSFKVFGTHLLWEKFGMLVHPDHVLVMYEGDQSTPG